MVNKKTHGGRRKGAGRKPAYEDEGPTVPVVASVPKTLADRIDKLAGMMGWNRSQTITAAIRGFLQQHKLL